MISTVRRRRPLSLTGTHLAKVARDVPRSDGASRFSELSEAELEALARQKLADLAGRPFWVFAYGSLIWKPAFEYTEARRGIVHGWRRAFCLHTTNWRATPEEPGLMLALARGGACTGIAYRMPDDAPFDRMLRLLRREISYHVDLPWLRWLAVRAEREVFCALTFYCDPLDDPDVIHLPLVDQARRLARAVGHIGSSAEYLHNTVEHLEALGIRDRYLWTLQRMVAEEINALPDRQ